MKSKWIFAVSVMLLGMLCGQDALAFYNSSTGRWLSRDPIDEVGFACYTEAQAQTTEESMLKQFPLSYAFCNDDGINYVDRFGLFVSLDTHPVALGMNHSFILLTADCTSKFYDDPRFQNVTSTGIHYATIGAGPEYPWGGGHLINGINRPKDVDLSNVNYTMPIFSFLPDDMFMQFLLNINMLYDKKPWYSFFPGEGTDYYNSNSYISGVFRIATGRIPVQPPSTPGFKKPVPAKYFGF